jgi:hypothetical protein
MRTILVAVVSGTAGILLSAWLAPAQSPTMRPSPPNANGQLQKAPSPTQSQTYAPSDIAVMSTGMPVDGRPRALRTNQLAGQAGMGKASAEVAPLIPQLCFQPGIGWTATTAAATPERASANHPFQARASVSSAQRALKGSECPPMPPSQGLANAGAETFDGAKFDMTNYLPTMDDRMTSSGGFQVLSPDAGTGNAARATSAFTLSEGATSHGTDKEIGPEAALEELEALRRRAYVSSVKLRRLSRNVQDMETRMELRRVNQEVEKRDVRSTTKMQENTDTSTTANHKPFNSHDLKAARAECARRSAASKPKFCSQLER